LAFSKASWSLTLVNAGSWGHIDVRALYICLQRDILIPNTYKVYGFLEVVAKTGRTETNGNAGAGDNAGRPWEEVHKTLSDSMKERLDPFRGAISKNVGSKPVF
jgi:hypothetical protein